MMKTDERGIALVLALFLTAALSVVASSLMFLSQTETYASMNYRMMSQARYAGEAGVQKASDFLLDDTQYALPSLVGPDFVNTFYNRTQSPVLCIDAGCADPGDPVVLSTDDAEANYPLAAVQAAFKAAAAGSLPAGNNAVGYSAKATLLTMQSFDSIGGLASVVQTWRITGTGTLTGARNATVEVESVIEQPKVAAFPYAAFATAPGCGALTFNGSMVTDSYDSTGMVGSTAPTMLGEGGDVGTNGNLNIGGSATVQGNLYTPRTGVGDCADGAVTAISEDGEAHVEGSILNLPAAVEFPAPDAPPPVASAPISLTSADCSEFTTYFATLVDPVKYPDAPFYPTCTVTGSTMTIDPSGGTEVALPTVSIAGAAKIELVASAPAATYTFNSLSLSANAEIGVNSDTADKMVVVQIVGQDESGTDIATPLDFTGGSYVAVTGCATCSTYDSTMLQFVYSGEGEIKFAGNSAAAATFYAPNAFLNIAGNSTIYGSVVGRTISAENGAQLFYDQNLTGDFWIAGHPMIGTFTWTRY